MVGQWEGEVALTVAGEKPKKSVVWRGTKKETK